MELDASKYENKNMYVQSEYEIVLLEFYVCTRALVLNMEYKAEKRKANEHEFDDELVAVVLLEAIVLHVVQVARHVPVHLLRGDHSARKQDLLIGIRKKN